MKADLALKPTCDNCVFRDRHKPIKRERYLFVRRWDKLLISLMTKHMKTANQEILRAIKDDEHEDYFMILVDLIEKREKARLLKKTVPKPQIKKDACENFKPKVDLDIPPVPPNSIEFPNSLFPDITKLDKEDLEILKRERELL